MENYYSLLTGLPDITLDGKTNYSLAQLQEDIDENVDGEDRKVLDYIFLKKEADDLVQRMKAGEIPEEDEIELLPTFMKEFVNDFIANKQTPNNNALFIPEDKMSLYYYKWAMSCKDKFVSDWFSLNFNMTNVLTALLARRNGWKVNDYVLGDNEIADMLRLSKSKDFDLSKEYDYISELMNIVNESDPVLKEKRIDAFKWLWLDERTFDDFFSLHALFAYILKLQMLERWSILDVEQGKKKFTEIIEGLRSEAKVPEI